MISISIILLIPVATIALIFLVTAAVKAGSEKGGGEEMIKNVYVYLILFTTLMMVIGGSVAAFMAAADIVSPTAYYQTFEDYKMRYEYDKYDKPSVEGQAIEKAPPSEEEMLANYNAMVQSEEDR